MNVIKFPNIRPEPQPRRRVYSGVIKFLACVAGAAVVTAVMFSPIFLSSNNKTPQHPALTGTGTYATQRGEHRCENLPDTSRICLNTQTVARYTFNRGTRNVELVSGEATFEVNSGDHRPFDVRSGGLLVHDRSTSFGVLKRIHSTIVTVVDGRVNVVAPIDGASLQKFNHAEAESAWKMAPEYHRLQQVEFDETTGMLHERKMLTEQGLSQLLAWQRGRINLNGRTLGESLEEYSRYQPIEKFQFQDEHLKSLLMGGEFEPTDLTDFLDTLEFMYHLHHTATKDADGNTVITLSRRQKH